MSMQSSHLALFHLWQNWLQSRVCRPQFLLPRLSKTYNSFMLQLSILATFWNTFLEKDEKRSCFCVKWSWIQNLVCTTLLLCSFSKEAENDMTIESEVSGVRMPGLESCFGEPFCWASNFIFFYVGFLIFKWG